MPKVPFNKRNSQRCRCPMCPVQQNSPCALKKLKEMETPDENVTPDKFPGLYCSQGRSACTDLDGKQPCMCPTCAVWNEYSLRSTYYCLKGNADING